MKTIYLVACAAEKRSSEMPAEELYSSVLFRKAREYVRQKMKTGDEWFILSAKHGLLSPSMRIGPYNVTLIDERKPVRLEWASRVMSQLRNAIYPGDTVVFLAGKRYREFLEPKILELGCEVQAPMQNKGIGQQLQWLGDPQS